MEIKLIYCFSVVVHLENNALGTNFLARKVLAQASQLYVQIGVIILSNNLSNTLRFLDANLLVLPSRVYITLLSLLSEVNTERKSTH